MATEQPPVEQNREDIAALQCLVHAQAQQIEHLKLVIAKLRRLQFGRSSEKLAGALDTEISQLQRALEELELSSAEQAMGPSAAAVTATRIRPARRRVHELLPWNLAATLTTPRQQAA